MKKMKKILIKLSLIAVSLSPALVFAQTSTTGGNRILQLVNDLGAIVRALIPIVFAIGILAFFWGLVLYIFSQGNEEKKKEGKGVMLWALVALFVMASVWGIIGLAQQTLNIQPNTQVTPGTINLPHVNQ